MTSRYSANAPYTRFGLNNTWPTHIIASHIKQKLILVNFTPDSDDHKMWLVYNAEQHNAEHNIRYICLGR